MTEDTSTSSPTYHLRRYQDLIAVQATKANTIVYLPTGSGKTFIAFHVLESRLRNIRSTKRQSSTWPTIAIFIAPTKALLAQHIDSFRKFCPGLSAEEVIGTTLMNGRLVDNWGIAEWRRQIQGRELLGMTPAILRNLLEKRLLPDGVIDLLILDECHHATGNNEMKRLCDQVRIQGLRPLILGLTASPIKSKGGRIQEAIEELEANTMCSCYLPSEDFLANLKAYSPEASSFLLEYPRDSFPLKQASPLIQNMERLVERMILSQHVAEIYAMDTVLKTTSFQRMCQVSESAANPLFLNGFDALAQQLHQAFEIVKSCGVLCGLKALHYGLEHFEANQAVARLHRRSAQTAEGAGLQETTRKSGVSSLTSWRPKPSQVIKVAHVLDEALIEERLQKVLSATHDDPDYFRLLLNQPSCALFTMYEMIAYMAQLSVGTTDNEAKTLVIPGPENPLKRFIEDLLGSSNVLSLSRSFWPETNAALFLIQDSYLPFSAGVVTSLINAVKPTRTFVDSREIWMTLPTLSSKVHSLLRVLETFLLPHDWRGVPPSFPFNIDRILPGNTLRMSKTSPVDWLRDVENTLSNSPKASIIVFCDMKVVAVVLSDLFNEAFQGTQLFSGALYGGLSNANQKEVLQKFRTGEYQVLFATNVAEEGLDIAKCNVVIHFDAPQTVKSQIQRRGRARANKSQLISLYPPKNSEEYMKLCKDLETFHREEAHMDALLHDFQSFFSQLGCRCNESLSQRYTVPTTGAGVDGLSAQELLISYCQSLKKLVDDAVTDTSHYYTFNNDEAPANIFSAKLYLPWNAIQKVLQIRGGQKALELLNARKDDYNESLTSKATRKHVLKGVVTVAAIRCLHELGELDDHLRVLPSLQRGSVDESSRHLQSLSSLRVKTVPYVLKDTPSLVQQSTYSVWMHQVKLIRTTEEDGVPISDDDIDQMSKAAYDATSPATLNFLNGMCIMTKNPCFGGGEGLLSKLGLDDSSSFLTDIRGISWKLDFELIGDGPVTLSSTEVTAIQIFHRAVLCLESDKHLLNALPKNEFGFADATDIGSGTPNFMQMLSSQEPIDSKLWSGNSKGCWYMVCPLLKQANKFVYSSVYAKECVVEALQMVHNLACVQERNATRASSLDICCSPSMMRLLHPEADGHDVADYVMTSSGNQMVHFPFSRKQAQVLNWTAQLCDSMASVSTETKETGKECETTPKKAGKTYRQHYAKENFPNRSQWIQLAQTSTDIDGEDHYALIPGKQLSGILTLANLLQSSNPVESAASPQFNFFVPEFCLPIAKIKWYSLSLTLPVVTYRFQSMLLARECREKLFCQPQLTDISLNASGEFSRRLNTMDNMHRRQRVPSVELTLEAITTTRCLENICNERLEFLGDSFLKLATSVYIFAEYGSMRTDTSSTVPTIKMSVEGLMTQKREKLVSNSYLLNVAKRSGMLDYLRVNPISNGAKSLEYVPPGSLLATSSTASHNADMVVRRADPEEPAPSAPLEVVSLRNCNIQLAPSSLPEHQRIGPTDISQVASPVSASVQQSGYSSLAATGNDIPGKVGADLIEALLGAAYVGGGVDAAWFILCHTLGVVDTNVSSTTKSASTSTAGFVGEDDNNAAPRHLLSLPATAAHCLSTTGVFNRQLVQIQENLQLPVATRTYIEKELGHRFECDALLTMAMTHSSFSAAPASYEALEFLGDGLLDFIVVFEIYQLHPSWKEGAMTAAKSALTCNDFLASFVYDEWKCELLNHVLHESTVINRWVFAQQQHSDAPSSAAAESDEILGPVDVSFVTENENSLVPSSGQSISSLRAMGMTKAVADVFEAMLGAVYLDAQGDLDAVRRVLDNIGYMDRVRQYKP